MYEQFGRQLDQDIASMNAKIASLELGYENIASLAEDNQAAIRNVSDRVSVLESTTPPEPPTEPPTTDLYPPAKTTVHVNPDNAWDLLKQASRAEPGTHFVFAHGFYDIHNHNFGGNVVGTADDPIVFRACPNETVTFRPSRWDVGEFGGIFQLYGQHVVIDGLTLDTADLPSAGRLLNVYARGDRLISENVLIANCAFFGAWRHAAVVQGANIKFLSCHFSRNCRVNKDGTKGVWPYTAGSWWYELEQGGERVLSENIVFDDCVVNNSYGEGLTCNYCYGGTITRSRVMDCRFAGMYFNNCDQIFCGSNSIHSVDPVEGRGTDFRAIAASIEDYSSYPMNRNGSMPASITNNLIDGGDNNGIRHALHWMQHRGDHPWQRYSDWNLSQNVFRNTSRENVWLDAVAPSAEPPQNCTSDNPLAGFIGNRDSWSWPNKIERWQLSQIRIEDAAQKRFNSSFSRDEEMWAAETAQFYRPE